VKFGDKRSVEWRGWLGRLEMSDLELHSDPNFGLQEGFYSSLLYLLIAGGLVD